MKSFFTRGLILALSAFCMPSVARAQYAGYGAPTMLPAQQGYSGAYTQPAGFRGYQTQSHYPGFNNGYSMNAYQGMPNANYYMVAQPGGVEEVPSPSDRHSMPGQAIAPQMAPQPQMQPQPQMPGYAPQEAMAPSYAGGCVNGSCGGYAGGYDPYGGTGCGPSYCGPSCNVPTFAPACGNWFGSFNALLMTRDHANDRWLSYNSNMPSEHLLRSNSADMNYAGGFETRFGRYFNCGWNAVEVIYWGLFPSTQSAGVYETQLGGGMLNSTMNYDSLYYNNGTTNVTVNSGYNDAAYHRVRTDNEFHNIEMNILGFGLGGYRPCGFGIGGCNSGMCGATSYGMGCGDACGSCGDCGSCGAGGGWGPGGPRFCSNGCNRLRMNWTGGVRYFRFAEDFQYATDTANAYLTYDNPNELFHNIGVTNDLIGFQLGGRMDYCLSSCFSLYGGTKMGIYGNHITQRQSISNSLGYATINQPASPYDGDLYYVNSSKNDVAFLGEIDLGFTYRFKCCWSLSAGYRVVALTGVALTTNQFPVYYSDLADVRDIDSNGSLILHGAYAGVTYNW